MENKQIASKLSQEEVTVLQPSLFSLPALQQECSRKFGITVLLKSKQTKRKTFHFMNGRKKAKLILKDDGSTGFNFSGGFLSKLVGALVGKR